MLFQLKLFALIFSLISYLSLCSSYALLRSCDSSDEYEGYSYEGYSYEGYVYKDEVRMKLFMRSDCRQDINGELVPARFHWYWLSYAKIIL